MDFGLLVRGRGSIITENRLKKHLKSWKNAKSGQSSQRGSGDLITTLGQPLYTFYTFILLK